jgi:hypothetical protein
MLCLVDWTRERTHTMSEETVVVVSEPEPAAPAAPEYVTPRRAGGALVELLRGEVRPARSRTSRRSRCDAAVTADVSQA